MEGTPISLKASEATNRGSQTRCSANTKAGARCGAPAVESGLCFFHAHPEQLKELGRRGGRANHRVSPDQEVADVQLRNVNDVTGLLAQTINQVRRGSLDPKTGNAVGYLAGVLLKALQQGD